MLAGAHKKFYRVQHAEIYLLDLKVQYKHKMKLSLAMVSKHIFGVTKRNAKVLHDSEYHVYDILYKITI